MGVELQFEQKKTRVPAGFSICQPMPQAVWLPLAIWPVRMKSLICRAKLRALQTFKTTTQLNYFVKPWPTPLRHNNWKRERAAERLKASTGSPHGVRAAKNFQASETCDSLLWHDSHPARQAQACPLAPVPGRTQSWLPQSLCPTRKIWTKSCPYQMD